MSMHPSDSAGLKLLTASQRDVVRSKAHRLIVGAGAGSGKTSTVVQMICHLLGASVADVHGTRFEAESTLELQQIAAITFTNEAAADLRRKLRQGFLLAGLQHLAAELDGARIGTIHGFCADLLREFALRAGLRPDVTVIDAVKSSALSVASAERAFLEALEVRGDEWLAPLTTGRKVREIVRFIQQLAEDTARLDSYIENREALREHESRLLELAARAVEIRRETMAREGLYDFDSLLVVARNLLRDHDEVRHAMQRRIRVLIVDEFQDVDPVQRDIAMLLGAMDSADESPSRIILVGDPKQSIFRFRRADVTLWNEVRSRFRSIQANDETAELADNFRSRKGILAFVDRVFGVALDTPVAKDGARRKFEVDYMALHAAGDDAEGDECVELRCVPPKADGTARSASEVRVLEAQDVASRIQELNTTGRQYGDIAILLAGWGDVNLYASALRARNIPLYVLRSEGFWESREVIDCLLALRAICDCGRAVLDHAAHVGFLKSPFVGVRDDTLLAMAGHKYGWRAAIRSEPRERALLDRARSTLNRFSALRDRLPLGELLQRLISETGFQAAVSCDPVRGSQALGNLRKLVRIASEAGDSSLGEWLREVDELRDGATKEPQERLYRERAEVVTITSIHSAKGLEWPVVFWCDLVRGKKPHTERLIEGRDLFRLKDPTVPDTGGDLKDPAFEDLKKELALERDAETYRLWYVAATRPKQLLVLSGIPLTASSVAGAEAESAAVPDIRASSGTAAALISACFRNELSAVEFPSVIAYAHADGTAFRMLVSRVAVDDDVDAPMASVPTIDADLASFRGPGVISGQAGPRRLSASRLSQFNKTHMQQASSAGPSVEWGKVRTANNGKKVSDTVSGTIVHDVLQHCTADDAEISHLVQAAIERHAATLDPTQLEELRKDVQAKVSLVIAHPRWVDLSRASGARRELTFTRILPDGSTIEGAMDLAAVIDGVSVILDVKSGKQADAESLEMAYAIQSATYCDAAAAIAGDRQATFELLQAADGMIVPVRQQPGVMMDVIDKLRSAATIARTHGTPPPA